MIQYLQILINGRLAKAEERGATAVEYGLLVALIAAVIIGAVVILGGKLKGSFGSVNDSLTGAGH